MFKAKTDTRFRPKIVIITVTVGAKTQKEGVIFFLSIIAHTKKVRSYCSP